MIDFIQDLLNFLIKRKKLWMLPLIIIILLIGSLLILAEGSVVAPLIYTIF